LLNDSDGMFQQSVSAPLAVSYASPTAADSEIDAEPILSPAVDVPVKWHRHSPCYPPRLVVMGRAHLRCVQMKVQERTAVARNYCTVVGQIPSPMLAVTDYGWPASPAGVGQRATFRREPEYWRLCNGMGVRGRYGGRRCNHCNGKSQ
jgi:hypothetical protein